MITNLFQSLGVVFSILVLIIFTVVILYLSYVLVIGIAILSLIFIVYKLLSIAKTKPDLDTSLL